MDSKTLAPLKPYAAVTSTSTTSPKPFGHGHAGAGAQHAQTGGEERRRSQRVLLRVAAKIYVAVNNAPATLDALTLSVNAHGALVTIKQNLPLDTRLILEHLGTREKMPCRVVRSPRDSAEGFHTAIEFDSAAPEFWRIAFPPDNWRPEDS